MNIDAKLVERMQAEFDEDLASANRQLAIANANEDGRKYCLANSQIVLLEKYKNILDDIVKKAKC